ncbi:MAG: hypothetical protein IJB89_02490 [Akkermansia sp.]|nr:hypothetical protein [Akkermansia sp.]
MIDTKKRERTVRRALLEDLANTPRGYMQPQEALVASCRLAVCPPPAEAELDAAFARLEADGLIHCEVDVLGVKRWCITASGRAALADC